MVEDSPAAEAGLEDGDLIISFDGEPVRSASQLRRLLRETPAGRRIEIEVLRDGIERDLTVELGSRRDLPEYGFVTPYPPMPAMPPMPPMPPMPHVAPPLLPRSMLFRYALPKLVPPSKSMPHPAFPSS